MRKGMETNEFLGFIVAVIGIVLLGFFGAKLYNFFVDADMKNAQAFVNDLSTKTETLSIGESNTFLLRGVKNWVLVAWNKDVPIAKEGEMVGKDRKPQKCFEKSCLCLCEGSDSKCQTQGYCRAIEGNISVTSDYKFVFSQNSFSVKNDTIPCYIMPDRSQLIDFFVDKKASGVTIKGPLGYVSTFDQKQLVYISCTKFGREFSFS